LTPEGVTPFPVTERLHAAPRANGPKQASPGCIPRTREKPIFQSLPYIGPHMLIASPCSEHRDKNGRTEAPNQSVTM
jgi:hypothetical protein